MAYIGNTPTTQSFISGTDYFNGTGSQTAFTLTRTVASQNDVEAVVNNVVQQPNAGYTISGTTITFTSAPSAGTQNVYVRYLSTTTQTIAPSQGTVGWNQLNTDTQQDLGISFKNRIINGNMVIDQRNAGASVTIPAGTTTYFTDRWSALELTDGSATLQQVTDAPTGFSNSLRLTVTGTDGSLTTNQQMVVQQRIEGFNTADLMFGNANAKTVTLSFQVKSSVTGTFSGSLRNSANDRSYPFTYTINSANTWEYETITIAGDTSGTWVGATNGIGLEVIFSLGAGPDRTGTAGAWASSNFVSATGSTNLMATNGATWQITGVMLEVGTQATTFTLAGGSYGAELALCQRYYESTFPDGTAPAQNAGNSNALRLSQTAAAAAPCRGFTWLFKTTKRTSPTTITSYNPAAANANVRNVTRTNDASITGVAALNAMGVTFTFTGSTGSAVGDDNAVGLSADAEL
jgi:hypothetical protein